MSKPFTKTIVIDTCIECPHQIFDDGEEPERWGKHWCLKLNVEVPMAMTVIPVECPLP